MEHVDYLLLLIGVLIVALITVEMIPMPMAPPSAPTGVSAPGHPYRPARISSAAISSVIVMPTSTLATVTVH